MEGQPFHEGVLDSVTQGATFGFGDELTAFEAAVLGRTPEDQSFTGVGHYDVPFWQRYDRALQAERAQQRGFFEEHPVTSVAAEIGGALPVGAAAMTTKGPAATRFFENMRRGALAL